MKLQGRELSIRMEKRTGPDVDVLHEELTRLGPRYAELIRRDTATGRPQFGEATARAVAMFQKEHGLPATGVVDDATATAINAAVHALEGDDAHGPTDPNRPTDPTRRTDPNRPTDPSRPPTEPGADFKHLVRGQVRYEDGLPIPDMTVTAYDRRLRDDDSLGSATTDEEGLYEIFYTPQQLRGENRRYATLIVRAFHKPDDVKTLAAQSDLIPDAQVVEKVNLRVAGGLAHAWSEYEQLMAELTPLLEGAALASITENEEREEVSYLSARLHRPPSQIAQAIGAHRLHDRTDVEPAVFYGFFRMDLPTALSELVAQSPARLLRALRLAITNRVIPGALADSVEKIVAQLHALAPAIATGKAVAAAPIADVLTAAGLAAELHTPLIQAFVAHAGPVQDFWKTLRKRPEFADHVDDIGFAFQTAVITGHNVPLVAELAQQRMRGRVKSAKDLARFDAHAWRETLSQPSAGAPIPVPPTIVGKDEGERAANYAQKIARTVERAYPREYLAHRIVADGQRHNDDVRMFFKNVLDSGKPVDFDRLAIDTLQTDRPDLLENVHDAPQMKKQLKSMQRVYKVAPQYAHMQTLMTAGFTSATAISQAGPQAFAAQMGPKIGGSLEALRVWDRASLVTASALNVMANAGPWLNNIDLQVLPWKKPATIAGVSWEELFGSADLCNCSECQSVLSPAAYFAELLAFLKGRAVTKDMGGGVQAASNARDILFERRPDLGNIELTCANTNTVMPYIDLVNEVLENTIAPFVPFGLPAATIADLDTRTLSAAITGAFTAAAALLEPGAMIQVIKAGQSWFVSDRRRLYVVEKDGAGVPTVTALGLQTTGTSEELAATPNHTNTAAYDVLEQAVFPWSLPLDLGVEELRQWIQAAGADRARLMEAFRPLQAPVDPDDDAISAERLGLTPAQRDLVIGATADTAWALWGLTENNNSTTVPKAAAPAEDEQQLLGWIDALSHVRVFMRQARCSYDELLALLTIRFVNPDDTIRITSMDPLDMATCDTRKLIITPLNAATLRRMHSFLRLWRVVGWTMRELDLAIGVFQAGEADVNKRMNLPLIRQLAQLRVLANEHPTPIEELLTLWGDIDTVGESSLWSRRFLNPSVSKPSDPAFRLKDDGSEVATAGLKISDHVSAALAGLGADASELADIKTLEVASDALTVANVSEIFRRVTLARALGIGVRELLLWKQIGGFDPFDPAHPEDTVALAHAIDACASVGLSVSEVDFLLRHTSSLDLPIDSLMGAAAPVLSEIRAGLARIREDVSMDEGASSDLARKFLALLKWDAAQVELVVSALSTTPSLAVPLDGLSAAFAFPALVAGRAGYDERRRMLTFAGVLSVADVAALNGTAVPAAIQPEYTKAVQALEDHSNALAGAAGAYVFPEFRTALAALPAGLKISKRLKARAYFDKKAGQLCFSGFMLPQDATELKQLPGVDATFTAAVDALGAQSAAFAPAGDNVFLTAADLGAMLAANVAPVTRFETLLEKLLPRLRRLLGADLIREKVADALGADQSVVTALVDDAALDTLRAPDFAESAASLTVDAARFPAAFEAYLRVYKAVLLASKLSVSARMIAWYLRLRPTAPARNAPWRRGPVVPAEWLDILHLPMAVNVAADPAGFYGLLRLLRVCSLRDRLRPSGEQALQELLDASRDPVLSANAAALIAKTAAILSARARSDEAAVSALLGVNGLNPALPADLRDETALAALVPALDLARRLNAAPDRCREWVAAAPPVTAPVDLRHALRARTGDRGWLNFARPVQDALRERKRDALVDYLLVHPLMVKRPGGVIEPAWHDVDGIYAHCLIDVQMSPCMPTSRIKQGLCSMQHYVQRKFLNIEPWLRAGATADDAWNDWPWMQTLTLWRANREIFLMPENWADMTTLDRKTPLFRELENNLQQAALTPDAVEDAFLKYLEGLDTLARLDLVGMYQQDNADGLKPVLHVIGRTHGTPHVYYHRRQESTGRWSPWEKVDLDIEGEHVIPLVWNRRLHLFWPQFKVKAQESVPAKDSGGSTPSRYFDIQLAWSEYKRGRWTPKRITSKSIRSGVTWRNPESNGGEDGRNEHAFFHQVAWDGLRIWPEWDSPSTTYSMLSEDTYGTISVPYLDPSAYVDTFFFSGCNNDAVIEGGRRIFGLFNPTGTGVRATTFEERGVSIVKLDPTGAPVIVGTEDDLYLPGDPVTTKEEVAFKDTPGTVPFRLLYPHQDKFLNGRRPFFFEDGAHAFIVQPSVYTWTQSYWHEVDFIDPARYTYVLGAAYGTKAAAKMLTAGVAIGAGGGGLAVTTARAANAGVFAGGMVAEKLTPRVTMSDVQKIRKRDTLSAVEKYTAVDKLFKPGYSVPVFRRSMRYRFENFDHPYACFFIHELKRGGIDTLMRLEVQESRSEYFASRYRPTGLVDPEFPVDEVDFTPAGAYSQYNWELFFYAPWLIASRFATNQQFDHARRWYHYIFNPTDTSIDDAPMKFWRLKPFHDLQRADYYQQRIDQLLLPTASGGPNPQLVQQLEEWRRNPFSPHAVARLRLTAYQKAIVMGYLDTLIGDGDRAFAQIGIENRDTIESINRATQRYVLAADILGREPQRLQPRAQPQIQTYNSLDPAIDSFSDSLVEIEYLVPMPSPDAVVAKGGAPPLPIPRVPYFCVPPNNRLLGYWRTIADRLNKLRHCQNMEGLARTIELFAPPIDPGLLARATAAGVDIGAALADLNAPLPYHRYAVMAPKAAELVNEVRQLGAALLAALEKRDAEALAQLRSGHEISLLSAMTAVKEAQVREAEETLAALENSRAMVEAKYAYYKKIEKVTKTEQLVLDKMDSARDKESAAQIAEITASVLPLIGDFDIGASGWAASPVVKWRWGGLNLGAAAQSAAKVLSLLASIDTYHSKVAEINARSDRQWNEWKQQELLAGLELKQIDKQIAAARLRKAILDKEADNHTLQIDNAKASDELLRTKYTNVQLYHWMVSQISAVYFQAYQLAYDRCKVTERCCRHELGLKDSAYIGFGAWDDLRQGLLAGERLMLDLKRLETAYLAQNRRELEITKHASLALLNPAALLALRSTGTCYFELPEALFDLDHPGHYLRRIKSISLTLPCVAGPYVSIGAKLTLLSNRIRRDQQTKPDYAWSGPDDPRFMYDTGGMQSVVTSSARDDNGLFELNLHDDRYLPFEGAGAVSAWRLELPASLRQFDYQTISDAVVHVRYTARDGGDTMRDTVSQHLVAALNAMQVEQGRTGLFRLLNLRTDFADEWHRFFYGAAAVNTPTLTLDLAAGRFPTFAEGKTVKIQRAALLLRPVRGVDYDPLDPVAFDAKPPTRPVVSVELQALPADLSLASPSTIELGAGLIADEDADKAKWTFELTAVPAVLKTVVNAPGGPVDMLDPAAVAEIGLLIKYTLS